MYQIIMTLINACYSLPKLCVYIALYMLSTIFKEVNFYNEFVINPWCLRGYSQLLHNTACASQTVKDEAKIPLYYLYWKRGFPGPCRHVLLIENAFGGKSPSPRWYVRSFYI